MLFPAGDRLVAQAGVRGDRDLTFGAVTRGIPATVPPADAVKSGQWTLTAPRNSQLQLQITLPTVLNGPAGATMPLVFGKSDAFVLEPSGTPNAFNPQAANNYRMRLGTTAIVRLGGRVTPTAGQATGVYLNTVVLSMTILN